MQIAPALTGLLVALAVTGCTSSGPQADGDASSSSVPPTSGETVTSTAVPATSSTGLGGTSASTTNSPTITPRSTTTSSSSTSTSSSSSSEESGSPPVIEEARPCEDELDGLADIPGTDLTVRTLTVDGTVSCGQAARIARLVTTTDDLEPGRRDIVVRGYGCNVDAATEREPTVTYMCGTDSGDVAWTMS